MRGRPLGSGKKLEERRLKAVEEVIKSGHVPAEVAGKYKIKVGTLYRWLGKYRKDKRQGLNSKPTPGAPRRLSEAQLARLEKMILKGAKAGGYPNDLWTCARLADLIKKKFGVRYHFNHVGKILVRMGWSPQRPEKQAIEKDDKRVRHWVKRELPEIKKKPANSMPS
jgi:putative transposase